MPEFKAKATGIDNYVDNGRVAARIVKVETPNGFSFAPGQFVMIAIPGVMNTVVKGQLKWASMSIASTPKDKGFIELGMDDGEPEGVRHYVCSKLKLGEEIMVKGPFGRFVMNGNEQELVFIALGTGITPIMGMVRELLNTGSKKKIVLFYSIKNSNLYLFGKELEELAEKFKNFELITTVTRNDASWKGERGRLQEHFSRFDFGNKQAKTFFICGSPKGVIEIIDALKSLGFKEDQIKKEQW